MHDVSSVLAGVHTKLVEPDRRQHEDVHLPVHRGLDDELERARERRLSSCFDEEIACVENYDLRGRGAISQAQTYINLPALSSLNYVQNLPIFFEL